ncbi:MAG TPA: DUF177 domain-containing protein [Allosphingosinicella sp.]|uniref:YceD family protein n=1 Tax=Allosphingosinicella sp. TaxID=2823234 RepID=UPI002ED84C01
MSAPEFSRTVRIDTLGNEARHISIGADEAERTALAHRFGLEAIDHLSAEIDIRRSGDEVRASGTLKAEVTQSCVASGAPVPEEVEERFDIVFRPQPARASEEDEIELSGEELDVVFYDGAAIDIGEAVAETMSLSLEPYPRAPDADAILKEAGVKSEEEAKADSSPFAMLRDKLKPGS